MAILYPADYSTRGIIILAQFHGTLEHLPHCFVHLTKNIFVRAHNYLFSSKNLKCFMSYFFCALLFAYVI